MAIGAGVLLAAGLVVVVVLSLWAGLSAKRDLQKGADQLRGARSALTSGHMAAARSAFSEAQVSFRRARSEAGNPLLRLEGSIPLLGRTPRALGTLALVGDEIAGTGSRLTRTLTGLPGGLSSLLPRGGRFPLGTYRSLAPILATTVTDLRNASRQIGLVPRTFALPQVGQVADLAQADIDCALSIVRHTQLLLDALPRFAGADSPRRYLVGVLNPAELRGPGGFMGLYAVATLRDGRLTLGDFNGRFLRDLAPGPEWTAISSDPDIPTVGALLARVWNRSLQPHIDGVIFLDPQFLSLLLRATGRVHPPGIHYTVDAGNVVDFITNQAYFLYRNRNAARKPALASVASQTIQRFLGSPPSVSSLSDVVASAGLGYLQLYSTDPVVERAFRETNVSGAYGPALTDQDFFGVVAVNQAGNKIDHYVRRSIRYEVTLHADGTSTANVSIGFVNEAPKVHPSNEVFGSGNGWGNAPGRLHPGGAYGSVGFFCGPGCTLTSAKLVGHRPATPLSVEGDSKAHGYGTIVLLGAGRTKTYSLHLHGRHAWSGGSGGGVYRLLLQDQPLITPATVTVVIRAPTGTRITGSAPSMSVNGGEAVWRRTLTNRQDLEIRFEPA